MDLDPSPFRRICVCGVVVRVLLTAGNSTGWYADLILTGWYKVAKVNRALNVSTVDVILRNRQ
jgi:hypothetical protein